MGFFHFVAVVNNATVHIHVQVLYEFSVLSDINLEMELPTL
jgi:hypothetical protein